MRNLIRNQGGSSWKVLTNFCLRSQLTLIKPKLLALSALDHVLVDNDNRSIVGSNPEDLNAKGANCRASMLPLFEKINYLQNCVKTTTTLQR